LRREPTKKDAGAILPEKGVKNAGTRFCARFALLSQSVAKAVETLAGLLDTGDGRLQRLAARDILDQHVKFRELDELTRRIEGLRGG